MPYAQLSASSVVSVEPGQSRLYRLPVMNPGQFLVQAEGHRLAAGAQFAQAPDAAAQPTANVQPTSAAAKPDLANIGGTLGGEPGIGNAPPGGPTNPIIPPPYPINLELFHGDAPLATRAPGLF